VCSDRVSAFIGQWILRGVAPGRLNLADVTLYGKWSSHIGGFPFVACEEKVGVMVGSSLGARF
jgi:hypothetical protein